MDKLGKNEKSLAGEFFTVAKLFVHGYVATPTLGKTKHMDIFAVDPKGRRILIEVKTTDEKTAKYNTKPFGLNYEWIMDQKNEDIIEDNLFYCFVLLRELDQLPRFFIVPSKRVAEYLKWEHKQWVEVPRKKSPKETSIRTFRVGLTNSDYEIGSKYEDNWNFEEEKN